MLQRLWWNRVLLLVAMVCMPALSVCAQYRTHSQGVVNGINVSLGSGLLMSNTHWKEAFSSLEDRAGGTADVQVVYELSKDWFVFGLGAGFDFACSRQHIDAFSDLFERLDREGDEIVYSYHYSDYSDKQTRLLVTVPVYIGARLGKYAYLLAGAKASFPVFAEHETRTVLETDGTYQRFIHTIQNAPTYGYYAPAEYGFSDKYRDAQYCLSPMVELGADFQLNRRVSMRVGAYVEYQFPLGLDSKLPLTDYSKVDINPLTQNEANLKENIAFNAIPVVGYGKKSSEYWTVGLRWTCRFVFEKKQRICLCVDM